MKRDIFIGGAWPYANYLLHIGHLAALLPGDIIARYYRENGDNVMYVSGSDTHGTPITERAKKEGKTPKEIATFYHNEFVKTFNNLNFSYDLYTSTMDEYHENQVENYILTLMKNGYIYEKTILQDYCEKCNKFLSDREIEGTCPHCGGKASGDQCDDCLTSLNADEVLDKHCKECGNITGEKENKHLYFKLSAFQNDLEKFAEENGKNWRTQAYTETKKFLKMGLIDRAITRQLDWGIEVPIDGYKDKRIYVWIEAVLGYLTTGKRFSETNGIDFDKYMSKDNDNLRTYFVHGKDNITFHSIIYPALLIGLKNNYQLPKYEISSGYVNMNSEKMSKSKGNFIIVNDLLKNYDVDTVRFYMTMFGPEKSDMSFNEDDLIQTHNKFLVGVLGNFVNRNLSFILKKFDGVISTGKVDEKVKNLTKLAFENIGALIEKGELKQAMQEIMAYITYGNKYYDECQPWVQVKENINAFNDTTYTCVYMMNNIANLICPIMPDTSKKIKNILKQTQQCEWKESIIDGKLIIDSSPLLFQRIEGKNN